MDRFTPQSDRVRNTSQADTTSWNVENGARCSSCGAPIAGRVTIRLGEDRAHRLQLGHARGLAEAILRSVEEQGNRIP